ncbi:l-3-72Dn [Drosophila busckii]|uniref:L-3-72Dn n=2 Tax=Drosophila busckii TaxID=30019 RepID=A0A0M4EZS7_DROBS|nr:l-3-72Dn [Drosophila busckii]
MAYSKELKTLAVSREEGPIELWNMQYAPYLQQVIHLEESSTVEAVAWAGKRLFSVGLTGKLIEWNLNELQPRFEMSPTGNALWCLSIHVEQNILAVGSEEGHINILSIENEELSYKTLFNKQKERVLCCEFDKPGERLVTGSPGAVRIWSVAKGHVLHTMTLAQKDYIAYTVRVLSNNTIIAGDSAGNVTVWDANLATQIDTYKVLDAKLFALAVNEREDRLVCSGMEPPLIRVLGKTQIKREASTTERWIKYLQRDVHKHYVKSLVLIGDRIISGGEDGNLCVSRLSKSRAYCTRHAPFLHGRCATLAAESQLLLLRYAQSMHLWRLGSAKSLDELQMLPHIFEEQQLQQTPEKLLELKVPSSQQIVAGALSPDNKWICYATKQETRLYSLQLEPLQLQRLPQQELPEEFAPASFIIFDKKDKLYLLCNKQLRCFELQQAAPQLLYSLDLSPHVASPVTHLELSACGKQLAVATMSSSISIWQLSLKSAKHLLTLPNYHACATALALRADTPCVAVAYADGRLVEYNFKERHFVCESTKHFVPNSRFQCIRSILFDAHNPKIILVHNEVLIYVLESYDPREELEQQQPAKTTRLSKSIEIESKLHNYRLKMRFNREHMLQLCRLDDQQLIAIGVHNRHLLAPLPAPYQRKKFGES